MKNRHLFRRIGYAIDGLYQAAKTERSIRTHLVAALTVFLFIAIVQPGYLWTAVITLVVCCVVAAELMNTAIESLCDRVNPDHDPAIKFIKDVAAGAVLVISVGAIAIGGLLLLSLKE